MHRNRKFSSNLTWVDVYSGPCFQGRIRRLRGDSPKHDGIYKGNALPRFGSLIVGPGAVAEFVQRGGSGRICVSQRTVLADATRLVNGQGLQSLRIAAVGN